MASPEQSSPAQGPPCCPARSASQSRRRLPGPARDPAHGQLLPDRSLPSSSRQQVASRMLSTACLREEPACLQCWSPREGQGGVMGALGMVLGQTGTLKVASPSGVQPLVVFTSSGAPSETSFAMASHWPVSAARCRGVYPPRMSFSRRLAPCRTSSVTAPTRPCIAA